MLHPVVLSGGSGSRLWPLSRQNQPKQFLALIGDRSLYQETVLRASRCLARSRRSRCAARTTVSWSASSCRPSASPTAASCWSRSRATRRRPSRSRRCISLGARSRGTMLVLPADHLIEDESAFRDGRARAIGWRRQGWLVTFGITPDCAGNRLRLHRARRRRWASGGYRVARFVEKPDLATAEGYWPRAAYAWNSGMFLFRAQRYLDELRAHAPAILAAAQAAYAAHQRDLDFIRLDKDGLRRQPQRFDRLCGDGEDRPRRRGAGQLRLERHRLVVVAVGGRRARRATATATRAT